MIHKPTAPALPPRKWSFCFQSLPSFVICPLQCKAGKSKRCLWSLSYGHVYPKPCCKSVEMKEPNTCRTHHTISPAVNNEASCNLSYLRPSFTPETLRVIDYHVQHPPRPVPALSAAHKLIHNMLGWWISATQHRQGLEPSLLLVFRPTSISRLRMRPRIPGNREQFGLHCLKWLHFLNIFTACKGKPI